MGLVCALAVSGDSFHVTAVSVPLYYRSQTGDTLLLMFSLPNCLQVGRSAHIRCGGCWTLALLAGYMLEMGSFQCG